MNTSTNLLHDLIAVLRGIGFGITHFAHEPAPKLSFRRLACHFGMSRCSVPCALHSSRPQQFLEVFE